MYKMIENGFICFIKNDDRRKIKNIEKLPLPNDVIIHHILTYLDYNSFINIDDEDFWIRFGIEHNKIKKMIYYVYEIFVYKYGKSYKLSKHICNMYKLFSYLSCYLDDIICCLVRNENININHKYLSKILNKDEVSKISVFYNLYTDLFDDEYNHIVKNYNYMIRKKMKILDDNERLYIMNVMNVFDNYISFIKYFICNVRIKFKNDYYKILSVVNKLNNTIKKLFKKRELIELDNNCLIKN